MAQIGKDLLNVGAEINEVRQNDVVEGAVQRTFTAERFSGSGQKNAMRYTSSSAFDLMLRQIDASDIAIGQKRKEFAAPASNLEDACVLRNEKVVVARKKS